MNLAVCAQCLQNSNQAQFKHVSTLLSLVSYQINITSYTAIIFKCPSFTWDVNAYNTYNFLHFVNLHYHSSLNNDIGLVLNNGAEETKVH